MKCGYTPKWVHPKKMITHFSEVFKDVDVKKNEPAKSTVRYLGSRCCEKVFASTPSPRVCPSS